MSVVTKKNDASELSLFAKGSPEIIKTLCTPASIPSDFNQNLESLTKQGFRVIAFAKKILGNVDLNIQREAAENGLEFLGLFAMENLVKACSRDVINELQQVDIHCIMATGDNLLTAIQVGLDCNILQGGTQKIHYADIVDGKIVWNVQDPSSTGTILLSQSEPLNPALIAGLPFENQKPEEFTIAMSGKVFNLMKEDKNKREVLKELIKKTQVFARMTPDQKAGLVELLQEASEHKVLMCGDGANDCAALKAADAGISLADSEASIAAPFSSKVQDVSCVPILLKEGRANLASTIQSFKFIMLYAMIQYTSAVVLYSIAENLSDN